MILAPRRAGLLLLAVAALLMLLGASFWPAMGSTATLSEGTPSLGSAATTTATGVYDDAPHLARATAAGAGRSSAVERLVAGVTGTSLAFSAELDASRAPGLVDEAATVGRSASTEWGRVVQNFQQHGDDWTRFSAHVEQATGRAYRGGTSNEEIFRRGDDWLVRRRVYGPGGDVLHETFRPYAKFGR